ncbi:hypothetical protein Hanom_Chr12g01176771 [Helianthus anomalus]
MIVGVFEIDFIDGNVVGGLEDGCCLWYGAVVEFFDGHIVAGKVAGGNGGGDDVMGVSIYRWRVTEISKTAREEV